MNNILAVVIARAGSKGLPGKALRDLLGRPVLAYTLDHVRASKFLTRTVVSTDDPGVMDLARQQGFPVIERPPELASDTAATDAVLRHAVRHLQQSEQYLPDAVVMLYGNVPLRRNRMIDRCIHLLRFHRCDSVQTIAPVGKYHPYWMFDLGENLTIRKHIDNNIYRRQDLPKLFSPTGAVYAMKTDVLLAAEASTDPHDFLGTDRRGLVVDPEDSVDIDTLKDLLVAEVMLKWDALERQKQSEDSQKARQDWWDTPSNPPQ